jgi:predicted lipoprotein with Yx(FWY)xxD motif
MKEKVMRKRGWAAAAGLGSLLLLAACGGSSTSNLGQGSTTSATATPSTGSAATATTAQSPTAGQTSASAAPSVKQTTPHPTGPTAGPQPSSQLSDSLPPIGTTIMVVQKSDLGFVLAEANHMVVYTYAKDKKGGAPTCTGSCASTWLPVTGVPQVSAADTLPGTLSTVTTANGGKQITYNGYPLYTYKGSQPYTTTGNNVGGVWHVVMLSESDITG